MSFARVAGMLAVVGLCGSASGQFTIFSDEGAFLSAVPGAALEDFNDENAVSQSGGVIDVDGFAFTSVAADMSITSGPFSIDGTPFFEGAVNANAGEGSISLLFDMPIDAFGGTFGDPSSGAGLLIVVDGQTVLRSIDFVSGLDNSFLGFTTDTPVTQIDLVRDGGNGVFGEVFGLDNVYFNVIPEPTSLGAIGLAVVLASRSRRR